MLRTLEFPYTYYKIGLAKVVEVHRSVREVEEAFDNIGFKIDTELLYKIFPYDEATNANEIMDYVHNTYKSIKAVDIEEFLDDEPLYNLINRVTKKNITYVEFKDRADKNYLYKSNLNEIHSFCYRTDSIGTIKDEKYYWDLALMIMYEMNPLGRLTIEDLIERSTDAVLSSECVRQTEFVMGVCDPDIVVTDFTRDNFSELIKSWKN